METTATITDAQIDELKAANPGKELHLLTDEENGVQVVVRPPSDAEWKRFRGQQADDDQRPLALRALVISCLVKPTASEFTATVLSRYPGLGESFGGQLVEIAGLTRKTSRRKL